MVEEGKYVAIHYVGKHADGEIFDSCTDNPPFEFQAGAGMVIPGLDDAVIGMKINDEKDIVIEPESGYGEYDEEMVHSIPRSEVGDDFTPEVGMIVGVQMEDGMQIPATVTEITDDEILIDLNHPLAGKTLHFHIKVLEINEEPKYHQECSSCDGNHQGGCSCC